MIRGLFSTVLILYFIFCMLFYMSLVFFGKVLVNFVHTICQ